MNLYACGPNTSMGVHMARSVHTLDIFKYPPGAVKFLPQNSLPSVKPTRLSLLSPHPLPLPYS